MFDFEPADAAEPYRGRPDDFPHVTYRVDPDRWPHAVTDRFRTSH